MQIEYSSTLVGTHNEVSDAGSILNVSIIYFLTFSYCFYYVISNKLYLLLYSAHSNSFCSTIFAYKIKSCVDTSWTPSNKYNIRGVVYNIMFWYSYLYSCTHNYTIQN